MANFLLVRIFLLVCTSVVEAVSRTQAKCGLPSIQPYFNRTLCHIPDNSTLSKYGSPRILVPGGCVAEEHSYPWMASLQVRDSRGRVVRGCGGTLIRASDTVDQSDIIVTAAHCYCTFKPSLNVFLGSHDLTKPEEDRETVEIEKVDCHPAYKGERDANGVSFGNDIAILKLARPVTFSDTIQPACLPEKGEEIRVGMNGMAVGWGKTNVNIPSGANVLHQAILPMYDTGTCVDAYANKNKNLTLVDGTIQLCAGYQNGTTDSCDGDSGGPWLVNSTGQFVLQGIVSWGGGIFSSTVECGEPDLPGVYVRVSYYVDWIKQKVKEMTSVKQ